MRKLAVIFALLSAVDVACAADLPMAPAPYIPPPAPPPVYNWAGFYLGLNGGWNFGNASNTATITGGPFAGPVGNGTGTANGPVAGGQAGYNWQSNAFVFGLEGDFDWSGLRSTSVFGVESKEPWIATIRGRAGFALDRVLFYGTVGAAFVDETHSIAFGGIGTVFSASQVNYGWTIGGGFETAFYPNWTARAEYLFVDTNLSLSGPLTGTGGTLSYSGTITRSIVRGGINYKFQ